MQPEGKKDMLIYSIIFGGLLILAGVFMFKNFLKNPNQNPKGSEPTGQASNLSTPTATPSPTPQQNTATQTKTYAKAPEMQLEAGKDYQAILKTNKGDIKIDLFENKTPITVNNFVFLAKDKFYDGVKFHRIIKDFMIQTGDPEGTGRGGPGYSFDDEKFDGEYTPGTVAMANAGPNTNGSQFFIMHGNVQLPKNYVIFGKVMDDASMQTVNTIANTPTVSNGMDSSPSKPTEDIIIQSVEIITK